MIIAKPVIDKKYWILKKDDQKVGIIEAIGNGYEVKIQNSVKQYKTIRMARKEVDIEFAPSYKSPKNISTVVHGYDTGRKLYNPLWDIKNKLPLFTCSKKSKSWLAAGWYKVKQHRHWEVVQNPKLITLQRYSYQGPFHTQEEAQ